MPIRQAVEWESWLDGGLGEAAQRTGVEFDGGEEEGRFEVYTFAGITADQLADLAAGVLTSAGQGRAVTVTGLQEVTVSAAVDSSWLVALGPVEHAYDREVKRQCRERSTDPALARWWAASGYTALEFQQSSAAAHADWFFEDDDEGALFVAARVDLSVLDLPRPPKSQVERAARSTVSLVLTKVARHLGRPVPDASAAS